MAPPPAFEFEPYRDIQAPFEPFARFAQQTDIQGQLLLDQCALEFDAARAIMLLAHHYLAHEGKSAETAANVMPLREVAIARQKGEPDPVGTSANTEHQTNTQRDR